jgi:D-glycerate 3-kinase
MSADVLAVRVLASLLPRIERYKERSQLTGSRKPFIFGLTGLQGSGKSTLTASIVTSLNSIHGHRSVEISLDDFYKTLAERDSLRAENPSNGLLKVRGQPGTHDMDLAEFFFSQFSRDATEDRIICPIFDKSLFNGRGDRLPESKWKQLNSIPQIDVIVFEGWCIGFQSLSEHALQQKWLQSRELQTIHSLSTGNSENVADSLKYSTNTLGNHRLEDLLFVNNRLSLYCARFMGPEHLDCLVHLDTSDVANVYTWRLEQEKRLWKMKGIGMTDEKVIEFGGHSRLLIAEAEANE